MTEEGEACSVGSSDSEDGGSSSGAGPSKKPRKVSGFYGYWLGSWGKTMRWLGEHDYNYIMWKEEMEKLQKEQVERANFDNSLNGVIERLGLRSEDEEDGVGADGDDVEAEAVSMAIRQHGLQRRPECSCHRLPCPLPPSIPFHRRTDDVDPTRASSSGIGLQPNQVSVKSAQQIEHDFLTEAVSVVIQKKGLGTFIHSDPSF